MTLGVTVLLRCSPVSSFDCLQVYYPCFLEAKKRYVGYAYDSPDQTEPKFDAKGIETVRRDSAPFVGEVSCGEVLKLLRKT